MFDWLQQKLQAWQVFCGLFLGAIGSTVAVFAYAPKILKTVREVYAGAIFMIEIRETLEKMNKGLLERLGQIDDGQLNIIQTQQRVMDADVEPWFTTDGRGSCLWVNRAWRKATGLEAGAARGHGWENGIHPDDRPRVVLGWQMAIDHQRDFEDSFRYVDRDGNATAVTLTATPIRRVDGVILNYIGHATFDAE